MSLHVKKYRTTDRVQLEQIILAAFLDDETMQEHARFGNEITTPTRFKTLVATFGDDPVGFASFYQNRLHYHPHDFHVSLVTAPEFQRKGIGRKLHQALVDALPYRLARLRVLASESSAGLFLEALHYRPLLRSFGPELPVQAVDLEKYQAVSGALEANGYTFRTLANLGAFDRGELVRLCLESYRDTHTHSPPTASEEVWDDIFLGEGCIDEAFFVALKDRSPVGFSGLRSGEQRGEMASMWDGVASSERALAFPLRLALKLREVEYARNVGVQTLCWEVDSVDLVGMQLLETLPFRTPPAYQVWVCDLPAPVSYSE